MIADALDSQTEKDKQVGRIMGYLVEDVNDGFHNPDLADESATRLPRSRPFLF
jgi:hypothetical protein